MSEAALLRNICEQCGQAQVTLDKATGELVTAPMLHFGTRGLDSTPEDVKSYHLDCLPHELEAAHRDRHGSRIDAAKNGVRGDSLRAVADDDDALTFDADDEDQHEAFKAAAKKQEG